MGRSDPYVYDFYKFHIKPQGEVALLGFVNNNWFDGDLYDLQLNNWNINDNWQLSQKYDTIISLRCPYFAKDPQDFIHRCYSNLNDSGRLYIDWGLGDHWRFDKYKIGWIKDGEQEHCYGEGNYLWSTVWDDGFLVDNHYQLFCERVKKLGYNNVKQAIFEETPSILKIEEIKKYFNVRYNMMTMWEDSPQLYVLLTCQKR